MCVQYWPAGRGREEVYSGVGVAVESEEQLANFMIRTIRLRKYDEERKVILFHYTEWPCHSNPFSNALLEFRRRVRNVMNHHSDAQDGPVIVHCKSVGTTTVLAIVTTFTGPSLIKYIYIPNQ